MRDQSKLSGLKSPVVIAAISGLIATATPIALAQSGKTILGKLSSGAEVAFIQGDTGTWGIEIAGGPAPLVQ